MFGFPSHHCVKVGACCQRWSPGGIDLFHNISSVQDSQGPRDEAKSYRPAIPSSLACPPLVQGHNDFIGFIDAKKWGPSIFTRTAASIASHYIYLWPSHPKWCCWQTFPGRPSNCHSLLVPGPFQVANGFTTTRCPWRLHHTSTVSSTFRTLASGSGASTMLFGTARMTQKARGGVFRRFTIKCGNK